MGSVKDLRVLKEPQKKQSGVGRFTFSDRYSVFDWGEMPDQIPNKGAALCLMGAYCLEQIEKENIKTHYRGLVDQNGKVVKTGQLKKPTDIMEVDLVRIIKPEFKAGQYDYSAYTSKLANSLLPLEVIYRNGLPEGSSVFKRLARGELTFQDLGLDKTPQPGERFEKPFFDVSTKLEERDRYLSWDEASKISGLSQSEIEAMKEVLSMTNHVITQVAARAGLINEDGKIELAHDSSRNLMLVDVAGTLDECRFTYEGNNVSKEVARQFYKKMDWHQHVEEAKKTADKASSKNWKKFCKSQPAKLPAELIKIVSNLYTSTANAFLERKIFNAPELSDVMKGYLVWLDKVRKA